MQCVDEKGDQAQTFACVAQSQCPEACKDAYSKQFNEKMSSRQQFGGIEMIFLADHAVCAPREARP
jgi:hypothetical protein